MNIKPTYEELEKRVQALEKEAVERKQWEEALQVNEKKYRTLIENAGEAIIVAQDGMMKFVNPKGEKLYGRSQEELTSKPYTEFIHMEDREMVKERYEKRIKGETSPEIYSFRIIHKSGHIKWTEMKVVLFSWDGRPASLCFVTDITDRVRAEEDLKKHRDHLEELVEERTKELKKSEVKYRTLFENASEAIYVAQDGMIKFPNPKTEELYGYSKEELASKPFTYFIHEKDQKLVLDRHKKRLRGEVLPSTYPFRIINNAGDTRWVELNVVAFHWGDRPATLCFLTDINERIQAEKVLKESEDKHRNIFNNAGEGIIVIQDSIFKFFNRRMLEILGYSSKDIARLANESFLNFIHPEYQELVADRYDRRLKGDELPSTYSARLMKNDGEPLWVDLSPTLISWGGKPATLIFVTDITERKQTEAALWESEEKYRNLLDEIDEGYFEIDLTGKFTFVSNWFLKIAGDSREDLLNMTHHDYMTPESAKKVQEIFTELFQTGNPVKNVVHEIITTKGEKRIHELSASLMIDRKGNPIGFRGTAHDVTNRVKAPAFRFYCLSSKGD